MYVSGGFVQVSSVPSEAERVQLCADISGMNLLSAFVLATKPLTVSLCVFWLFSRDLPAKFSWIP